MKIYVGITNGIISDTGYVSLKEICKNLNVSYNSATRGKRIWIKHNNIIEIKELDIIRVRNRGKR